MPNGKVEDSEADIGRPSVRKDGCSSPGLGRSRTICLLTPNALISPGKPDKSFDCGSWPLTFSPVSLAGETELALVEFDPEGPAMTEPGCMGATGDSD